MNRTFEQAQADTLAWVRRYGETRRRMERAVLNLEGKQYDALCRRLDCYLLPDVVDAVTREAMQRQEAGA